MRKRYIAAAVAVAVVGLAGAQQHRYQKTIRTTVDQLTNEINTSYFNDNTVHASVHSQRSHLFSSSGVLTLVTTDASEPTEIELEYTVSHGPMAIFMGAQYNVNIANNLLWGKRDKTITKQIFNDQNITIDGSLRPHSITGTLTLPSIRIAEEGHGIHTQPVISRFSASRFNEYGWPNKYQVSIEAPAFVLTAPELDVDIQNSFFIVNNNFNKNSGFATGRLAIEQASALYKGDSHEPSQWSLNQLELSSKLDINEELKNTFLFTLDNLSSGKQRISDTQLSYSFHGIDGQTVLDFMQLIDTAQYEEWLDYEYNDAIRQFILEREQSLLAFNPQFNLDYLKSNFNGNLLVNASGTAELDMQHLPANFISSVAEGDRQNIGLQFLEALIMEFEVELGDNAIQLLESMNPIAAAVVTNLGQEIVFKMKYGEVSFNDNE